MVKNGNSGQRPHELNLVRLGQTYLHTLALRQWILRKERSLEAQESEKVGELDNLPNSIEQKSQNAS